MIRSSERPSIGTVVQWSLDEGWGVIDSVDTPGGCWAHFSVVIGEGDELRRLSVGAVVPFTWEAVEQDGYRFRAVTVGAGRLPRPHPGPSSAYSSTLTISFDHGDSGGAAGR